VRTVIQIRSAHGEADADNNPKKQSHIPSPLIEA
jgi:hypothetical protein